MLEKQIGAAILGSLASRQQTPTVAMLFHATLGTALGAWLCILDDIGHQSPKHISVEIVLGDQLCVEFCT